MTLVRKQQIVYGVRLDKVDTAGVDLVSPTAGATTQEDANKIFDSRLTVLENNGGGGGGCFAVIDCGSYETPEADSGCVIDCGPY